MASLHVVGTFISVLLLISTEKSASFFLDFGDAREILSFSREVAVGTFESLEWIRKDENNTGEDDYTFIKRTEKKILKLMKQSNQRLEDLQRQLDQRAGEIIDEVIKKVPQRERLNRDMDSLNELLGRINDIHQQYIEYYTYEDKYEVYTRLDFARNSVSLEMGALPDLLASVHRIVMKKHILNSFAANSQEAIAQICDEQQSPQQLLYNLYNIIAMTEIRGFMMMQFSYTILRLHKNGTFHDERLKTLDDYKTRVSETLRAVRTAMAFAPRDLWRCDPDKHVEDVTYTELKQLFQGYIVNEVDLNPSKSCRENCAYYSYSNVQGCFDNLFCAKQRKCNGKVLNCQYFDSDMWICPSDINSNRRYEYVEYEDGRVFGKKGSCKKPITKVDSWWRWIFWHCSYCMCYCDDHNSSSDLITGFKFIKVNQIIHVQIQEGKLTERGRIEENSASWKPVDNYTIRDRGVNNGEDYHTLSWEKRAIDLDDLTAPDEHILTGVRFRMVGSHLNFEVRITPFNYSSGLLIRPFEKSQWTGNLNTEVSNGNSEQKRRELVISNPDVPIRIRQPSSPDSLSNQFLNFGPTDLDKDAAQSTIPFLDTQPVITNPPFPLAGAGIYHKGRSGSGGYIALKAITYDFKDHLRADVPSIPAILELNQIPAQ
ncbi:GSCOCG00004170001-RA-CDS [Cotesia congregata]|nr:GSCOCG00004170001-RA-CDS [Cotesia congregata]